MGRPAIVRFFLGFLSVDMQNGFQDISQVDAYRRAWIKGSTLGLSPLGSTTTAPLSKRNSDLRPVALAVMNAVHVHNDS